MNRPHAIHPSVSRLPRYGVRTLLATVAIVAVAIGWWVRPRSVDVRAADGSLAARFVVRHDWRGELVACGLQQWYLPDGQCFRQQQIHGVRLQDGQFVGAGRYEPPVYPPHACPDPPTAEYVSWLRRDEIPVSTDLPSSNGQFRYP